jgi:ubiquinone/menaquinone biosynthesis C-methylase UbiE
MRRHREQIVDQFTRQALPFSIAPGIRDAVALQLLVDESGASAEHNVLDVACGPGLVVRAFAGVAAHVTGIDVTPAMIARARELVAELRNVSLEIGDVQSLPYADETFHIVVSRLAFHHFADPRTVLREMRRVCKPAGRVVVCDLLASSDPEKAEAFHRVEVLRDPSHVRARSVAELTHYFAEAGLTAEVAAKYKLPFELDSLLARSFPADGDTARVKSLYLAAVDTDAIGLDLKRVGNEVHGAYDVAILRAVRS